MNAAGCIILDFPSGRRLETVSHNLNREQAPELGDSNDHEWKPKDFLDVTKDRPGLNGFSVAASSCRGVSDYEGFTGRCQA